MKDMVNPWKGRRVFLTGHTGFKGGWLSLWLASRGAQIRGYALEPSTTPNLFTAALVAGVLDDVRGDVRDYAKLEASMKDFAPEVVFHLAAQPLVRRSYTDPLGTISTNIIGTAHVMEAVRNTSSVRAVVGITSDKCYENREWIWPYREVDTLGGYDPYSASKACAEIVSAAFRSSFFPADRLHEHHVALATARAGNVIGGGDWSEDRLIPDLIRGFQAKQPVLIRRPNSIRPWQHVLEPLNGYIMLAERLLAKHAQFASAFNFGPERRSMACRAHCKQTCRGVGRRRFLDTRFRPKPARGPLVKAGCQQGAHGVGLETAAKNRNGSRVDRELVPQLAARSRHAARNTNTNCKVRATWPLNPANCNGISYEILLGTVIGDLTDLP